MKSLTGIINEAEKSKKQKEYQDFFDKKLEKFGVKSPSELDDTDKKKFFNEIDKEWDEEPTNERVVEEDKDSEDDEESEKIKDKKEKDDSKVEDDEDEDEDDEDEDDEEDEDEEDEDEEDEDDVNESVINEASSIDVKTVDKITKELMGFKNIPGAFSQLVMDIMSSVYDETSDYELINAITDKVSKDIKNYS